MMRAVPTWLTASVRRCERAVFVLPGVVPHAPRRNAIVGLLYLLLLFVAINVVYAVLAVSVITPVAVRLGDGPRRECYTCWCIVSGPISVLFG